jgi:anti-sigma B factor antagonist
VTRVGDLEVTVEELPKGGTLVRIRGELDLATTPEVEKVLSEVDLGAPLVIDLTECGFLDSSAVRVLLATARHADESGKGVSLVAPDPGVRRALEIAGLGTIVPIHTTLAAAL